jgi:hypothetical protein
MRDLNYQLKELQKTHKEGSFGTRHARKMILNQTADTLHELGYKALRADTLKSRHVDAVVKHWTEQGLSPGTVKNRMSHMRWWAQKIGKPAIVARSNDHYAIERRVYVTGVDKSRHLDEDKLDRVTDQYTTMSLKLQEAFGLRREEAIKFSPSYADKGDKITLKASWTKGGKARDIPIRNEEQRKVLDEVRRFAGKGAMIPSNKNYVQQLRTYERNTLKAGLDKNHGLRHAYAQQRYQELTGWPCPALGGPKRRDLESGLKETDQEARLTVSRELGHERVAVVAIYLA